VSKECHVRAIDGKGDAQIVVGGTCIELRARVSGVATERHVATILGEKDSVAGATLDVASPVELPDREIGIPVKGEQDTGSSPGIANEEADQLLGIHRLIGYAGRFR